MTCTKKLSLFVTAICFAASLLAPQLALAKKPKKMGPGAMPPVFVEAMAVKTGKVAEKINATGSLLAINGIELRPEIAGRVSKILFKSGTDVKEGQPLIQLNQDILKATFDQAQAKNRLAEQSYGRMAKLIKSHMIAQSDLDQALANLNSAKAALAQAKAQLDLATIKAPFSGRIGLKQVSIGDYVTPGQNLASLQALDPIDVEFQIPEKYLAVTNPGDTVTLKAQAYPDKTFSGKIFAIDSKVNPTTRSVAVRARITNSKKELLPGSFGEVTLTLAQHGATITVPQTAISYEGDKVFVYKVVNNVANIAPITLGNTDETNVVITSGLKVGDVIVTAGQVKLHPGAKVVVTNMGKPAPNKK